MLEAIKHPHLSVVKHLLASGVLHEADRNAAVAYAVKNEQIDVVNMLLANGPISERCRTAAESLRQLLTSTSIE